MAVELVGISHHQMGANWRIEPFSHPHYEMLLIRAGRHGAQLVGDTWWSGAGDVVLYPPGRVHAERTAEPSEWLCLGFHWDDAPPEVPCRTHDQSGRLRLLGQWLLAERDSVSPRADHLRQAFLAALVAEYLETFRPRETALVRHIRGHVREHLADPLTLAALARQAGCSKYHFVRRYREQAGITPMADVRRLRLERARELTVGTSLPLKSVAAATGLGDVHAFSRLFRRHFGLPPSHLRG